MQLILLSNLCSFPSFWLVVSWKLNWKAVFLIKAGIFTLFLSHRHVTVFYSGSPQFSVSVSACRNTLSYNVFTSKEYESLFCASEITHSICEEKLLYFSFFAVCCSTRKWLVTGHIWTWPGLELVSISHIKYSLGLRLETEFCLSYNTASSMSQTT